MTKTWFVHLGGEVFGPVTTETVVIMLRQTRLHFSDFIWQAGFTKWTRISDVDDFARLLPPYPQIPIPKNSGKAQEVVEEAKEESTPTIPFLKEETRAPARTGRVATKADKAADLKDLKETVVKKLKMLAAHPRYEVHGTVQVESGKTYKIVDLSEGGVFLATKEPLEIGTEINFTLEADGLGEKLRMAGVIIRHGDRHNQAGFAVEFMRLNPVFKRLIQTFLAGLAEAG
jgi:Tfp pilus assembly protein PilZ